MGWGVSIGLYKEFVDPSVKITTFSCFIATSSSITAFPVLGRILVDLKLMNDPVGVVVLASGVANDVIGESFQSNKGNNDGRLTFRPLCSTSIRLDATRAVGCVGYFWIGRWNFRFGRAMDSIRYGRMVSLSPSFTRSSRIH